MAKRVFFDEIFVVTAPGLEPVCAAEVEAITGKIGAVEKGGVSFSGGLEELYRVNLWSRTASRVLVRVGKVHARDFPELHRKIKRLPWGRFVKPEMPIAVRSTSRRSRLNHTGRLSETINVAIDGALGRTPLNPGDSEQLVLARIEDDVCQLSVDSSGELLHRRGYRSDISKAPLRENLAAGILNLLDWKGQESLFDPMCGSGTFLIEAALLCSGRAPGRTRRFAFQQWPRFRDGLWQNLLDEARRLESTCAIPLVGNDVDAGVVEAAVRNAERAACGDLVSFSTGPFDAVDASAERGLMICNPPYGVRLGDETELISLYQKFGQVCAERFKGWRVALFCPSDELIAATQLPFKSITELSNGGIRVRLFVCQL